MTFKEKVYQQYVQLADGKIQLLKKSLQELSESAGNETKRTAGDKHETALAMLQIEQENISRQLNEAIIQKSLLEKIEAAVHATQAGKGSLVKTNKGFFFISLALGKIIAEGISVIALSPESPLGKQLMLAKQNDSFTLNGTIYIIEQIE